MLFSRNYLSFDWHFFVIETYKQLILIVIKMEVRDRWVTNNNPVPNKRYKQIKETFLNAIHQCKTSQDYINYYDFLLVAKKLRFRFEQSSHLMSVKNYFIRNRNMIAIKTLSTLLCINRDSLHPCSDKIIVKFNVPQQEIGVIQETQQSDEEKKQLEIDEPLQTKAIQEEEEKKGHRRFKTQGEHTVSQQINDKIIVILSIKLEQMDKKLDCLLNSPNAAKLFQNFNEVQLITYEYFKKCITNMIGQSKKRIKFTQEDIRTLFMIICEANGLNPIITTQITCNDIEILHNREDLNEKLKDFYYSRINRQMIKKTKFKLPKTKNSPIQIFQVKSAFQLDLSTLEENIIQQTNQSPVRNQEKNRLPNFGPLRALSSKRQLTFKRKTEKVQKLSNSIHTLISSKTPDLQIQRQRINKILRASKDNKKKNKTSDTITSKLRSLFIHKVILPRQKVLDLQRQKYTGCINKIDTEQFSIKPYS